MIVLIERISENYSYYADSISKSKIKAAEIYSLDKYTLFIDNLMN